MFTETLTNVIYSSMILLIMAIGIFSGVYVFIKTRKSLLPQTAKFYLYLLSFCQLLTGLVYGGVLFGFVDSVPLSQVGVLMRPITLLSITIPTAIVRTMGLL